MVKVGIVGCGGIARVHASILKMLTNVALVGFADCKIERAQAFSQEFGDGRSENYESLDEMLEHQSLDVVHICTPHAFHVPMAIQILRTGCSVFMEKPPAISKVQFAQLKETAAKSKGTVGVCFQNRYNETTHVFDELLNSGKLGDILGARAFVTWNRTKPYYTESGWRGTWETEGGGALINQAVHTLDLLVRWLGTPTHCEATMANHHLKNIIEVEDTVEALIEFGEKKACFYATTAYVTDVPIIIELECELGRVRLEESRVWVDFHDGQEMSISCKHHQTEGKSYWGDGHHDCIADFYQCLKLHMPYQNSVESVETTLKLMMDLYESAAMKR